MSTAKSVFLGEGRTGFRVEYVRTRGVLRIAGWDGTRQVVEPVEHCIRTLLEQLGVALAAAGPFMLFANAYPAGGSRDFVAAFGDLAAARKAMSELRRSTADGWAEVVHLDAKGRLVQDCWYGTRGRG